MDGRKESESSIHKGTHFAYFETNINTAVELAKEIRRRDDDAKDKRLAAEMPMDASDLERALEQLSGPEIVNAIDALLDEGKADVDGSLVEGTQKR